MQIGAEPCRCGGERPMTKEIGQATIAGRLDDQCAVPVPCRVTAERGRDGRLPDPTFPSDENDSRPRHRRALYPARLAETNWPSAANQHAVAASQMVA